MALYDVSTIALATRLCAKDGAIFVSMNNNEIGNFLLVADELFPRWNQITIPVVNNLKGRNDKANIAQCHEYVIAITSPSFVSSGLPLTEQQKKKFKNVDASGENDTNFAILGNVVDRIHAKNVQIFFPIYRPTVEEIIEGAKKRDVIIIEVDGVEGPLALGVQRKLKKLAMAWLLS
ncbi:MAG: hypothetical protein U5K75_05625 [Ahrensia sp.]|nr:hypothetical protein [Ahrensia sp.]